MRLTVEKLLISSIYIFFYFVTIPQINLKKIILKRTHAQFTLLFKNIRIIIYFLLKNSEIYYKKFQVYYLKQ